MIYNRGRFATGINYTEEVKTVKVASKPKPEVIKIDSLNDLKKLGFVSVGTGMVKNAKHHLWSVEKDGDTFLVKRSMDEDGNPICLQAEETTQITASKKTAIWKGRLQKQYNDFEEFESYNENYGLAERLGFDSAEEAWEANPMIQGGTDPEDYKIVKANKKIALTLWKRPSNYMGEDFNDYYVGVGQSRDSDVLEKANFEAALEMLGGENPPDVIVEHARHWAVGYVEQILVHKDSDKVSILEDIESKLESYPVLDESLYSDMQHEEYEQDYESWAKSQAIETLELEETEDGRYADEEGYSITEDGLHRIVYDSLSEGYSLEARDLKNRYDDEKEHKETLRMQELEDLGQQKLPLGANKKALRKKIAALPEEVRSQLADFVEEEYSGIEDYEDFLKKMESLKEEGILGEIEYRGIYTVVTKIIDEEYDHAYSLERLRKEGAKKTATIYKVETEYTSPVNPDIVFSANEEVESFKIGEDQYALINAYGQEIPLTTIGLNKLIQDKTLTKIGKKKQAGSSTDISKLRKDIQKIKDRLSNEKIYENFGQREVRQLEDKYDALSNREIQKEIDSFNNWAMNYTGATKQAAAMPEEIISIWDNGGETVDRYTIMFDETQGKGAYLGLDDKAGRSFSMWGEGAVEGEHLGKEIDWTDLSTETQEHIIYRLHEGETKEATMEKKSSVEWDKEAVAAELYSHFNKDIDEDDAEALEALLDEINETLDLEKGRYDSWGNAGSVTIDGTEYNIIEDEDEAERIAIELVKDDLENEPSVFNQDWLVSQIDDEKAERVFREIYSEWDRSYAEDIKNEDSSEYTNRLAEEMVETGIITEEEGQDADFDLDDKIDEFAEQMTQDKIDEGSGGYEHYKFNFGEEEAAKLVMDNNLIDIDEAAESAVNEDGWAHFLSHNTGDYSTTENGLVFFEE